MRFEYPLRAAGPARVAAPLRQELLRVVAGAPRDRIAPVVWTAPPGPAARAALFPYLWLELLGSDGLGAVVALPRDGECALPAEWFDFCAASVVSFDISACVFGTERPDPTGPRCGPLYASVLGAELAALKGVLVRPLVDDDRRIVGQLTLDFLVIKPIVLTHSLSASSELTLQGDEHACQDSEERSHVAPLFSGHRGMGSSKPCAPWRPRENSIQSFIMATKDSPNVNHVELDVQLSRDGHPIVYHDWFFHQSGARDSDKDAAPLKVPLYNLTLKEFDEMYRERAKRLGPQGDMAAMPEMSSAVSCVSEDVLVDRIRTLKDLGSSLPEDVGLLIEVKVPPPNVKDELMIAYPERNHLIDIILQDLTRSDGHRNRDICFLSFDADTCMMLNMKQDKYPVYFSSCERLDVEADDADPRTIDVDQGLLFAQSQGFFGMVLFTAVIHRDTSIVTRVKDSGMSLLSYGAENAKEDAVRVQQKLGVDGFISDDVTTVAKQVSAAKPLGFSPCGSDC